MFLHGSLPKMQCVNERRPMPAPHREVQSMQEEVCEEKTNPQHTIKIRCAEGYC